MRWKPHVDGAGKAYPLNHLHPFRYTLAVNHSAGPVEVEIRVAFAMHCFTRARADGDDDSHLYRDAREIRSFCPDRYALSWQLPDIARTLTERRCSFAKADNYVTIDMQAVDGVAAQYGVFFNVMRKDGNAVLLTIQSAYQLGAGKQVPGRGSVRFARLVELTLARIKPRVPRYHHDDAHVLLARQSLQIAAQACL